MSTRYASSRRSKGKYNDTVTSSNVTDPREKERNQAGFPATPAHQTGVFRKHLTAAVQREKDGPAKESINEHTRSVRREILQMLVEIASGRQLSSFTVEGFLESSFFMENAFEDIDKCLEATNVKPQQAYTTHATTEEDFTTLNVEDAKERTLSQIQSLFIVLSESMCQVNHRAQGKRAFVHSKGYANTNKHKFDNPMEDLVAHLTKLFESNSVRYFMQKSAIVEKHGLSVLGRILNTAIYPGINPKTDFKPGKLEEVEEQRERCVSAIEEYFRNFPRLIENAFETAKKAVAKKYEDAGDIFMPVFDGDLVKGYLFKDEKALQEPGNNDAQEAFFKILSEFWQHFEITRMNNLDKANAFFDGQRKLYSSSGGMTSNAAMTHYLIMIDNMLKEAGIYLGAGHAEEAVEQYNNLKKFLKKVDLPDVSAKDIFEEDLQPHEEIGALKELKESISADFDLDTKKCFDLIINLKTSMKEGSFDDFIYASCHNHFNFYGEQVPECKNVSDDEEEEQAEPKSKSASSKEKKIARRVAKEKIFTKFGVPKEVRPFAFLPKLELSDEEFQQIFKKAAEDLKEFESKREEDHKKARQELAESAHKDNASRFGFDLGEQKDTISMNKDEFLEEKERRRAAFLSKLESAEYTEEMFQKVGTGMNLQDFIEMVKASAVSGKSRRKQSATKKKDKQVKIEEKKEPAGVQQGAEEKKELPEKEEGLEKKGPEQEAKQKSEGAIDYIKRQSEWDKHFDFELFKKAFPHSNTFQFLHLECRLYFGFFKHVLSLLRDNPEITSKEAHVSMRGFLEKSHPLVLSSVRRLHMQIVHLKEHYPKEVVETIMSFRTKGVKGTDTNETRCALIFRAHALSIIKLVLMEMLSEVASPAETSSMITTLMDPLSSMMQALDESGTSLNRGVLCESIIYALNTIFDLDFMSPEIKEDQIPGDTIIGFRDLGPDFNKDLFSAKKCQKTFRQQFHFLSQCYNPHIMNLAHTIEMEFKEEYGMIISTKQSAMKACQRITERSLPWKKKDVALSDEMQKEMFTWITLELKKENAVHVPYQNDRANCCFNCFRAINEIEDDAVTMREKVSNHVRDNEELFRACYFPEDKSQEDFFGSIEQWIERIKDPFYFGDTVAVESLVVVYEKRTIMRDRHGSRVVLGVQYSGNGVMVSDNNFHWEGGRVVEEAVSRSNNEEVLKQYEDYCSRSYQKETKGDEPKTGEELMADWSEHKKKKFKENLKTLMSAEIEYCAPKAGDAHKKVVRMFDNTYHPQRNFMSDDSGELDPVIEFQATHKPFSFNMTLDQLVDDMVKHLYGGTMGRGRLLPDYDFVSRPNFEGDLLVEMRALQQAVLNGSFIEGKGVTGVDYSPEDPVVSGGRAGKNGVKTSGGKFAFLKNEDEVRKLSNIRRLCFPLEVFFIEPNTYLAIVLQIILALSQFLSRDTINWDFFDFQSIQWKSRNRFVGLDPRLWDRVGSIFCRTMKKTFYVAEIYLPPCLPRKQLVSSFVSTVCYVPTELSFLSMGDQTESVFVRLCKLSEMACKADIPEVVSHCLHQHLQNGSSPVRFCYRKVDHKRNCWQYVHFGDVSGDEFQSSVKQMFSQGVSSS